MPRDEYLFVRENKKNITSVDIFAEILDIIGREYFKYKEPITLPELQDFASNGSNSNYHTFFIRKKNGKKRRIDAPNVRLAQIQNCIRILLAGFAYHGKSIVDHASLHIGKDIVYNMDIKDFFASITAIDIAKALIKYQRTHLKLSYDVALLLAHLVTVRSKDGIPVLPQGSPSSPIIAEIVVKDLDTALSECAKNYGCIYSRYVDDITFSGSKKSKWRMAAKEFCKIISNYGFALNKKKSRVSFYYQKQQVTGLTVNQRLNVEKKYIKNLRTVIHNWEKDGYVRASNLFFLHYYQDTANFKKGIPTMEQVIAGKLSFLKMIRQNKSAKDDISIVDIFGLENDFESLKDSDQLSVDPLWEKLHQRYKALIERDANIINAKIN